MIIYYLLLKVFFVNVCYLGVGMQIVMYRGCYSNDML